MWRDIKHYSEEGTASWLSGIWTATRPPTATCRTAPCSAPPTATCAAKLRAVTNLDNGLETIVRSTIAPSAAALIDLSTAAAAQLEMVDGVRQGAPRTHHRSPDQMVGDGADDPMPTPTSPAAPAARWLPS